jgi:hypothetical protein
LKIVGSRSITVVASAAALVMVANFEIANGAES